ncbi:MAG: hypothetical protein WBG92_06495 [Thiohalocapsa sp.]
MSAIPADIARGLEVAFPGRVEGGPLVFRVTLSGAAAIGTTAVSPPASMELAIAPGSERVIALLRLPTLRLSIRFPQGEPAIHRQMLARFDLVMRRGGG